MSASAKTDDELLAEAVASYALDPLGFVRFAYPWGVEGTQLADSDGPREWQTEVLQDIGDRLRDGYEPGAALMPVLKAVASGHGIGKSALVSWLVCWAMSTCVDTKVVLTANTEPQIRTKTMVEVAKWFKLLVCASWFKTNAMSIHSTLPAHDRSWRCDAVTWSEQNTEAFAGLHNKGNRIVLIFDEASGIIDRVWEVAEGALTDEDTEILWCAFGNPTQPTGRFFQCFGKQRARWAGKQIDSRTVPGTNKALFAEWVELYGEDSDFVRVRVRGMFPSAGSDQFIGTDLATAATARDVAAILSDPLTMGVDVARFGDDQTVIYFRKGRDGRLIKPIKMRGADTMQVAARVADEAARYRADAVFIDGGGMGAGVVDRCRQLKVQNLHDINFGAKADRANPDLDTSKMANKRAEMWGFMREWLKIGGIPDDAELHSDLTGPLFGYDIHNAILLESKKAMKLRGLASPDMGDALALTFAYPVQPAQFSGGPHAEAQRQKQVEYDPWN